MTARTGGGVTTLYVDDAAWTAMRADGPFPRQVCDADGNLYWLIDGGWICHASPPGRRVVLTGASVRLAPKSEAPPR